MKPERVEFYMSDIEQIKIMGPQRSNGVNGNAYYISIWVKVTQVSNVAHGPLV